MRQNALNFYTDSGSHYQRGANRAGWRKDVTRMRLSGTDNFFKDDFWQADAITSKPAAYPDPKGPDNRVLITVSVCDAADQDCRWLGDSANGVLPPAAWRDVAVPAMVPAWTGAVRRGARARLTMDRFLLGTYHSAPLRIIHGASTSMVLQPNAGRSISTRSARSVTGR